MRGWSPSHLKEPSEATNKFKTHKNRSCRKGKRQYWSRVVNSRWSARTLCLYFKTLPLRRRKRTCYQKRNNYWQPTLIKIKKFKLRPTAMMSLKNWSRRKKSMKIKRQVWLRSCDLISNQPSVNKMQLCIKRIVCRCPLKTTATFLAIKSKLKLTGVVETLRTKAALRCSLLLQRQSNPSKTIIVLDRKKLVQNLPLQHR